MGWMGVAVSLALGACSVCGAPPVLMGLPGLFRQAPPRPAQVHAALNNGIDSYRRADYETADKFLQQAQDGRSDLSPDEQQELEKLQRLNGAALKGQQEGAERLRQAEKAFESGRSADAEALLKTVITNQFLTAAEKAKAQNLSIQLHTSDSPAGNTNYTHPLILARTKLQQARQLMAKGNYDAAEALAHEAEPLKADFRPGEDTPQMVLNDIARLRRDPKQLLAAARTAFQAGDLDRAESLAKAADKASTSWTFSMLGDNPGRLLKEIQAVRARQAAAKVQAPSKPKAEATQSKADSKPKPEPAKKVTLNTNEAAHDLLKQGRKALQRGDLEEANKLASQASELKGSFHWWEDNPTQLAADIQRAAGKDKRLNPKEKIQTAVAKPSAPAADGDDPRKLVKKARDLFNANQLDEAEKAALKAQKARKTDWGLFDDTPEVVLKDVRAAKIKHDQEESARVLAEARKLLEKGDYEAAKAKAYQAERLHGPYGYWDFGDRPAKLLADIGAAQAKNKGRMPSKAPTAMVKKDATKVSGPQVINGGSAPVPDPPVIQQAGLPVEPPPPQGPPEVRKTEPGPIAPKEMNVSAPPPMPPAMMPTDPATELAKRARALLVESRQLQKESRLVEARQKALEAQKIGVTFNNDEDQPERALLQVTDLARKRILRLQQEASDLTATAGGDPARYQRAEEDLEQAKNLAVGFALDTQAIDAKASWLKRARNLADTPSPASGAAPAVQVTGVAQAPEFKAAMPPPAPPIPSPPGQDLLEKARLELRRGELETARRLAVEVYNGPFDLRAQADAVLHSIDAEEFSQRILAANRSFDAGMIAYCRHDFVQAANIFRSIDVPLLAPDKQTKLKELLTKPELQLQAATPNPAPVAPPATPPMGDFEPGRAAVSDLPPRPAAASPELNYAKQVQAMQEIQFQKLRDDGLQAQTKATERFRNGDTTQALEILQDYLNSLRDSQLDQDRLALLQRPVESRLQGFKKLKAQQDFEKEQVGQRDTFNNVMQREAQMEEHKKQQVAELMKQYHTLYSEGKYHEAALAATKARELDPENPAAGAAIEVAKMHANLNAYNKIKTGKEEMVRVGLNEAEEEGPAADMDRPLVVNKDSFERTKGRKPFPKEGWSVYMTTERQREIERRLSLPISLDFRDQTLKHVLDDLRDMTGINIVPDLPALEAENISLDRPITMHLEGVSTKSALDLVLHQAHLIYVIKDEVVLVTTEAYARGKLVARTYPVADLVIPVDNATLPTSASLTKTLEQISARQQAPALRTGSTPFQGGHALTNGTNVSSADGGSSSAAPAGTPDGAKPPDQPMQNLLIKMITSTIQPASWSDMGGPGTIEYWPLGLALVVNQTPDIQEQVADLLAALRRLQDLEVTVEVRFITLSEAFYERIGLDFNLNIQAENTKNEQLIVANAFRPAGFNNVFTPESFITGLLPGGTAPGNQFSGAYTPDMNIPIRNSSFAPAIPPFGGFPNTLGTDGGLSLGLAFLSDIQVFLFMEAAQADRRTNVMQAPKLTLFNGQAATINIQDQQFFVTDLTAIQVNGQVVFVPQNTAFPLGVQLAIQAVVSADRRFVRLNLNPNLSNLASPVTALFPVTVFITPVFDNGAQGQPVPFTQYVQQPQITNVQVNTTVNIPDGGTVILGGLKTMREGRNEFGPPILSKLPYVNRLFKNVGYGREAESLLIMVTPRIIINEEEETIQTGVGQGTGLTGGGGGEQIVPPPGGAAQPTR
jgi:type II secretory pathway component GspD/PulD (secretin)